MNTPEKNLYKLFEKYNIHFTTVEHEPAFTVEGSKHLHDKIIGAHTKSLFLKVKKKEQYVLISMAHDKQIDLK